MVYGGEQEVLTGLPLVVEFRQAFAEPPAGLYDVALVVVFLTGRADQRGDTVNPSIRAPVSVRGR